MSTDKTQRFHVLPNNALGVRDIIDGNNIHLGSKIEAVEVATMLNVFHDKAVECKGVVTVQAHKILELTEDMQAARELYKRQEQRIIDAEYKGLQLAAQLTTAEQERLDASMRRRFPLVRKDSEIVAEEHY